MPDARSEEEQLGNGVLGRVTKEARRGEARSGRKPGRNMARRVERRELPGAEAGPLKAR